MLYCFALCCYLLPRLVALVYLPICKSLLSQNIAAELDLEMETFLMKWEFELYFHPSVVMSFLIVRKPEKVGKFIDRSEKTQGFDEISHTPGKCTKMQCTLLNDYFIVTIIFPGMWLFVII